MHSWALWAAHVSVVPDVRAEMCFKVSEDYGNIVAAWRAAVDIATTYIRDGRQAFIMAFYALLLCHESCKIGSSLLEEATWH